ncbi:MULTISPECIES: cellulose biosynthesis protein BcsQ [Lelliottia]|jgi:cellulose synthase operon protein YhjQ|uniref:Cellulose biosynthesis protein BcsQ n=1 Tax=Lelliottia wanjuensis TaxID=3050585 RepID=A0AAP4FXI2_9ENTR|nr:MULTISPECIES: cellulose biosynthesis protein BcsQ [unclassified Lelliottia]MDI3360176.1 cellulose biosynthesis protein BcsQ [Lelliottia sp. V89_13]MDK9355369.1 cellulose biosynthesis protein BcsQ [Lelliottia sp. V106_16]MDK9365544.1 cellulose biosynthesis protein BcsQ [Lelliottia sp. V106_12]MDK9375217.1 cellulose biosynthesis protein BcsQ [Lelliottia sp. V106_10]MDK9550152.1 cellulose biosynthesis protein BcsQ [Lelliottia sp. V89_5]
MAILGLQGIRGGVGTTSITAALGWALQILGESVLVIDACPDNLLRMSFNVDYDTSDGWARALLDGRDWRDTAQRYTSQLDILPFGQLTASEKESMYTRYGTLGYFADALQLLQEKSHYKWILLDLPSGFSPLTRQLIEHCDHTLTVVNADANCHIRLHQQVLPNGAHILINDLRLSSQIQDDLYQVWLQSQRRLLPMVVHRDEAIAECLASKQPLGEYRSDSLAAEEILTLANWCLLHYTGRPEPAGGHL